MEEKTSEIGEKEKEFAGVRLDRAGAENTQGS